MTFFPDNQLGQEIDVINSVKLGVIDMMVSGTSISANLVPLVGVLRPRLPVQELPAADQGVRRRRGEADRGRAAEGRQHRRSSAGRIISARAACWRSKPINEPARSRGPEDPHAAEPGDHRMPAPDGRRRDAAGVRRDLHRACRPACWTGWSTIRRPSWPASSTRR